MAGLRMYHNPACSHSRGADQILRDQGADVEVIEYLHHPLSRDDFGRILDLLADEPSELVRKDKRFEELGLSADDYRNRDEVIDLLLEHPELMQRPVVIKGDRAVIARPSEKVLDLL